jgi:uncharacterized membrane protein YgdD (TMEM256/DUF423 family)
MTPRALIVLLAALHGLAGVVFAAVGAHVAGGNVVLTGAFMELFHALAALAALALVAGRLGEVAALAFLAGALLFSSALYSSVLAGIRLGPAAPAGGLLMMAGWVLLGIAAIRMGRKT